MQGVSVIVPVLVNSIEQVAMTIRCIKTAKETTKIPFQVVIVETLTDYFKDLSDVYIWEKEKTNATISLNRAYKAANTEWKVLLTNDVFVKDGWLEAMFECFKQKEDCAVSTLASNQFNHNQSFKIEEGNWWSIALIPQWIFDKVGYFDEDFRGVWDDTDMLMRIYRSGLKMYRNFSVVVDHLIGESHYDNPKHLENYQHGEKLFYEKHKGCGIPIFDKLK
jgi:GT2 family glycosyltransferase